MVVGMGIIADANGNKVDDFKDGLDLNNNPLFKAYAPNAPVLAYGKDRGYTVRIGEITYKVFFTWGGNDFAKQRFVTEIPVTDRASGVSAGKYILPIQYNERTREWVTYNPANWYDAANQPIFTKSATSSLAAGKGNNFDKKCAGCHFTATSVKKDSLGEYVSQAPIVALVDPEDPTYIDYNRDGYPEMTNVGCESCHGPGSSHVMLHGDPKLIIKPADDFKTKQANETCGRCHIRGVSLAETYEFPYNEIEGHDFILGDDLYGKYYKDKPGLWPDGKTSRQHHQQFQDLNKSGKPNYQFHEVTCYECHDVHYPDGKSIRKVFRSTENGKPLTISTATDDNTLCLACHATHGAFEKITKSQVAEYAKNVDSIGKIVSAHSHHPYAPERRMGLSRCTECHMPLTAASGAPYDIRSHTFEAISPQKTLMHQSKGGMPNSCAISCHRNIVDLFPNSVDSDVTKWTETSDVKLAEWLLQYFGPAGKWWKIDVAAPPK
jgi:hypothetical protein